MKSFLESVGGLEPIGKTALGNWICADGEHQVKCSGEVDKIQITSVASENGETVVNYSVA